MLRRNSVANPLVDERQPYPTLPVTLQHHEHSSFTAPEGSYTLAYELSPPPPPTPATPSGNSIGGNAAAALANAALAAIPEHPSRLVTATILFPPSTSSSYYGSGSGGGGGLLGLGGSSQKAARSREASANHLQQHHHDPIPIPIPGGGQGTQSTVNNSDDVNARGGAGGGGGAGMAHSLSTAYSPLDATSPPQGSYLGGHAPLATPNVTQQKKRTLVSLPSMSSMPLSSLSLTGGGSSSSNNASSNTNTTTNSSVGPSSISGASSSTSGTSATTSKPKSAFRGTSSNFIRGYEGLPLNAKADKLWHGAETREVTLAVFTTPRYVMISDISLRAKSRVSGGSCLQCRAFKVDARILAAVHSDISALGVDFLTDMLETDTNLYASMPLFPSSQDPIARLSFASQPTSVSVNTATLSHDRLDIIIGFASGDILWVEAFSGRYTRYNKDPLGGGSSNSTQSSGSGNKQQSSNNANSSSPNTSVVSSSPVKKVAWLNGDSNIFASAFTDGCIAFWDKDREDPSSFIPAAGLAPAPGPIAPPPASSEESLVKVDSISTSGHAFSDFGTDENASPGPQYQDGQPSDQTRREAGRPGSSGGGGGGGRPRSGSQSTTGRRYKAHLVQVDEHTDDIVVTVPSMANDKDKKKDMSKYNPLAHWKVSRKAITGEFGRVCATFRSTFSHKGRGGEHPMTKKSIHPSLTCPCALPVQTLPCRLITSTALSSVKTAVSASSKQLRNACWTHSRATSDP